MLFSAIQAYQKSPNPLFLFQALFHKQRFESCADEIGHLVLKAIEKLTA